MEHDSASKPVVAKKASPKRRASKKRKRAKKDPNMPKRGLSSYMFFAKEYRPKLLKEDPSLSIGDVGKKTGAKWKEMTNEDKEVRVWPRAACGAVVCGADAPVFQAAVRKAGGGRQASLSTRNGAVHPS